MDFLPDVAINPDALPILSCKELANAIPDFEWDKGHSGLVLTDEQAEKLEQVWADFLKKNEAAFSAAMKKDNLVDLIYMSR